MVKEAFAKAAAKPVGTSGNDFLQAILRERLDLQEEWDKGELMAVFPEYGNRAHTVILGNEVFKGLVREEEAESFALEVRLMQHMQGRVRLIPQVRWVSEDSYIFSMTKMEGIVFEEEIEKMTSDEFKTLARDVAGFVADMAKAFTDEDATEKFHLKPELPDLEKFRRVMEDPEVRAALGDDLPDCERIAQEYHRCFSSKKPIVMHADLHTLNGFLDPETKRVTGVIDFGIVKYCVPEYDDSNAIWNKYYNSDYYEEFEKAFCEECKAQGLPIDYRHRALVQFADTIEELYRDVEGVEQNKDKRFHLQHIPFVLRRLGGWIDKIDAIPTSTPPEPPAPSPATVTASSRGQTRTQRMAK